MSTGRPLRTPTARAPARSSIERTRPQSSHGTLALTAQSDSSERYRFIVETAVDAIVTIGGDGVIDTVNPATERLFGYRADEMVGRNVAMLMPEPDASRHDGYLARYLSGGEPRIIGIGREVIARRKDGTTFPVHLAVGEMEVDGRRMFTGVMRDLSALRAAEREAAAQRDYAAGVLSALRDGLVVLSPAGVVLDASDRFLELVGLPREQVVGVAGPPFPWHAEPAAARDALARIIAAGGGEAELVFVRPSGEALPVQVSAASRHDRDGRFVGLVATCRDLSPMREAEAHVRRAEAARAESESLLASERDAQRLKDEFLAMVSHELRTPLAAVVGYLELAMNDVADPDVRALLEVAERNGRRLSALVGDILLVAQADAGRLTLDRRPVLLGDLVRQAVLAARPSAGAKGVELEHAIAANPSLQADPGRLGQVLDNLISNAIKFSPAGGRVRVALESGPAWVRITVSDDGPGIPEDEVDRLFEPFYRARQASHDVVPGSGLGLAVVKAIAEAHGGAVGVETKVGRGSVFRADLPLGSGEGRVASLGVPA